MGRGEGFKTVGESSKVYPFKKGCGGGGRVV